MPLRLDPNRFSTARVAEGEAAGVSQAGVTRVQPNPAFLAGGPPDHLAMTAGGGVEHRQSRTLPDGTHVLPQGDLPRQPPVGAT